jgi:hypothetical protein
MEHYPKSAQNPNYHNNVYINRHNKNAPCCQGASGLARYLADHAKRKNDGDNAENRSADSQNGCLGAVDLANDRSRVERIGCICRERHKEQRESHCNGSLATSEKVFDCAEHINSFVSSGIFA